MGLILFEDEHLLAVEKPPGLNTHSPSPFAGEGLYEWLRNRHPDRDRLAILHRLDKETSGVIVFGKTPEANRSLSAQFEGRSVRKTYILLTERPVPFQKRVVAPRWFALGIDMSAARNTPGRSWRKRNSRFSEPGHSRDARSRALRRIRTPGARIKSASMPPIWGFRFWETRFTEVPLPHASASTRRNCA
jgi:23S rRNA-/tRNA-specific pseudouridylate synthase